jgi:hypothetical protein
MDTRASGSHDKQRTRKKMTEITIGVDISKDHLDAHRLPVADENLLQLRQLRVVHQALVKERTRLKNRRQTITLPLLKRQHDNRLRQIERDIADVLAAITAVMRKLIILANALIRDNRCRTQYPA